ncbi:hypothetical protein [Actinosynnema sp. NPDC020468]|uniref:SCO6745 family protein n=1 Tax=Actinosynnema sp. NPDC020468 TaxID=3154488 RepID=UPI0033CD86FF
MSPVAERTQEPLVRLGGAFMVSPELAEQEKAVGLPPRTLYFRGRTAVLGNPEPGVVAAVIAIFPEWLVEAALVRSLPADRAVAAYLEACWTWSRGAFASVEDPGRVADLGFRVADAVDPGALALFRGWRDAPRPADDPARLGHVLMLLREFRGGIHFAALRAVGLTVAQAVALDPGGGRPRFERTAWRPEDYEPVLASVEGRDDLAQRWRTAMRLTDERFDEALGVLTDAERVEFADRILALG